METTDLFLKYVRMLLPVFSAASCILLVIFSLSDSITRQERRLKLVTASYFLATAIVWIGLFAYSFYPKMYLWFNVPLLLCFLLVPVVFYHIMVLLTTHGGISRFSMWHYVAPVVLSMVLLIWSLSVPVEIQFKITTGFGEYTPAGHETYTRLFTSKPLLRLIFGIVYFIFTLRILHRYYHKANTPASLVRKPARWVVYLMVLLLLTLAASLITAMVTRNVLPESFLPLVAVTAVIGQHLLLTYHIIRRKYLMYVIHPGQMMNKELNPIPSPSRDEKLRREHHGIPLTGRKLETYFRREKPYLKSEFKITDLVAHFDLNRSTISGFINKEYGINFTRYVNRWRLDELDRLTRLPSNQGKSKSQLTQKAGFTNVKHYRRSLQIEQGGKKNELKNEAGHE